LVSSVEASTAWTAARTRSELAICRGISDGIIIHKLPPNSSRGNLSTE
jgi:hypothetical protein